MIVGIGSDLCNIERIQKSLDRWGDKFLNRVFTETERAKAASRPHTIAVPRFESWRLTPSAYPADTTPIRLGRAARHVWP